MVGYIDPGSGSFVIQAIVASLAGVVVAVSTYWHKIKRFLGMGTGEQEHDEPEGPSPGDE